MKKLLFLLIILVVVLYGCGGVSSENYDVKPQGEIVNDSTKSLRTKEFAPPLNTKPIGMISKSYISIDSFQVQKHVISVDGSIMV